ncbi:hypothetical protein C5B96_03900 [Subtercola sp. Z020]|uniref:hypothetical protein n=1 Tax=Subtercola sp. Z020 TaxID=2080582 RepID=UPI000CE8FDA0|nr:hypothetical protein [Subtercola sp. Z020]PPF87734.1 hypothetical protein C5B96_03900 [Subtercola sp. Z020]
MTDDAPGRAALVSPVLTLLGGVSPSGMVCDVNGVCAPVDATGRDGSPADRSSTDDSSTDGEK